MSKTDEIVERWLNDVKALAIGLPSSGTPHEIADKLAILDERDRMKAALRYGCRAEINELVARDLPAEWSPNSGIGKMLSALGCSSTTLDAAARAALEGEP